MMDLKNVNLLALQSLYMRQDPTTQALCAALEPLFHDIGNEIQCALIYGRIDSLSGSALDEVAWGYHVDGYDALAPDDEKQRLIKNSFFIHRYKGTAYAVEKNVASVFGGAGSVSEWFDYGGQPYHFRVEVECTGRGITAAEQFRVLRLIECGKNLRSTLDGIHMFLTLNLKRVICAVGSSGMSVDVFPLGKSDTFTARTASVAGISQIVSVWGMEE